MMTSRTSHLNKLTAFVASLVAAMSVRSMAGAKVQLMKFAAVIKGH